MATNGNELLSAYAASRALEKDRQTIVRALRDVPPDGMQGDQPRWKLATIVKALEAGTRGVGSNGKSQETGLTEARAELTREQTAAVALKNAVARGEYVPLAQFLRAVETVYATMRERLLAVPGKTASSCEMRSRGEVEEIIRAEIHEVLDELSKPIIDPNVELGGDSSWLVEGSDGSPSTAEPELDRVG